MNSKVKKEDIIKLENKIGSLEVEVEYYKKVIDYYVDLVVGLRRDVYFLKKQQTEDIEKEDIFEKYGAALQLQILTFKGKEE